MGEFPEASVRLANGTAVDGSRGGKMARSGALIGYDVRTTGGAWKDKTEPRGAVTVEKKKKRKEKRRKKKREEKKGEARQQVFDKLCNLEFDG